MTKNNLPILSVIIPTFNNVSDFSATLSSINSSKEKIDFIVADGGSNDGTIELAISQGARLVRSQKGRGTQLAAGANAAVGNWLLFLHADTLLGLGWQTVVHRFINDPRNIYNAAYFIFTLNDRSPKARRLEKIVRWRCNTLSLPYGDQGLLISRKFYNLLGGYPQIPLMEDIEIIRTINASRLKQLPVIAITSANRYSKDGYFQRSAKNLFCLALYFLGVPSSILTRIYSS